MEGSTKKIIVNLDALQMKQPKKQTRKKSTIVPNNLKTEFMKRVQNYKSSKTPPPATTAPLADAYTDEFNSSIEYLNNLTNVQVDLPKELENEPCGTTPNIVPKLVLNEVSDFKDTFKPVNDFKPVVSLETPPLITKYKVDTAIPYGCLKSGIKPSYKNWTRSNRKPPESTIAPKQMFEPLPLQTPAPTLQSAMPLPSAMPLQSQTLPSQALPSQQALKPIDKRTIIRRHVLGKSKKSNKVGVLIKNVGTRKQITDAYKDLRKTNILTVKNQLKNAGLLKVGTTAPNDILRQTYESAILAGKITNKSEETLVHNFIHDK